MSATTPTVQGGYRNLQLGTALVAIALAIVVVAALVALGATASRGQAQAAPQAVTPIGRVGAFDRGYAAKRGPIARSPYAVQGDHGWATDARIAAPTFLELPRPFDPATLSGASAPATMLELPRVFDPSTVGTPAKGGQGTRFAQ